MTQELSEQVAADLVEKVRQEEAQQAEHAAELKEQGRYGFCEDCGAAIEAERLEFLPNATRCVNCQAAFDRSLR